MKAGWHVAVTGVCLAAVSAVCGSRVAAQGTATPPPARPATSAFNSGAMRAPEDPVTVAHGKTLYGINCQACHGSDLRGGDMGGPSLLRSAVAMSDQHGEEIVPIIQGGRQAQGMPKIGISVADSEAVAAYVRSVIGTIGRQGTPPGGEKKLNIVVGDAAQGKAYFGAHCASCHSATGDLRGIGTKFADPKTLQAAWVSGRPARGAPVVEAARPTVTVTVAGAQPVSGQLVRMDDFLVTLKMGDGSMRSFRRSGDVPAVAVQDPAHWHQQMLPNYTDAQMHDVTAYLVTLK